MSRFVSAGADADSRPPADDGWLRAQQEVQSSKEPRSTEEGKQEGGKSLYEVLQANKAAKQDAFEEAARLKNQFRALDEDEVDFLDSILETSRAKEDAVKQETAEQLDAFRKQRAAAEQAQIEDTLGGSPSGPTDGGSWATKKKKRRREKDGEPSDTKLRKLSTADGDRSVLPSSDPSCLAHSDPARPAKDSSVQVAPSKDELNQKSAGLGLAAYSSDEDD
ncbi:putative NEFA-interacting nuclear protein NIP30 [Cladophialophora carrionii]|uniref:Putative NEFA-interacting nuclear protein NIP30 n=1 Tax=Cladophialophora carrionii TaxID=86049 RepID=A0A1C1CTW5_9EURO|nr:putative NEFA-interacting nuclear protein NIP30 [Cladophialophora carrionii]